MKSISAIEAKFIRCKINARDTKLWKELNEKDKLKISSRTGLLDNDVPILYYYQNDDYLWVLTSRDLIIFNSNVNRIPLPDIENVSLDEIFENKSTKYDCQVVNLSTTQAIIDLKVERGTWPIIYDLFRFVSLK